MTRSTLLALALALTGCAATPTPAPRAQTDLGRPLLVTPSADGGETHLYLVTDVREERLYRDTYAQENNWHPVFRHAVPVRVETRRWVSVDVGPDGVLRDVRATAAP